MKRIVILGAGESGAGAAVLAKKEGFDVFVSDMSKIADRYKKMLDDRDIAWEEGQHTEDNILNADEIIKSPGIPDTAPMVRKAIDKGIHIISEIEFAGRYTNSKMVCITGSNGKTTTTSLIYDILCRAGLDVGLAGNIGHSLALQVAEHDRQYYVIELSSFQLDNMYDFRANIAILLNITPDHLDRYNFEFQNYINAKMRITRNQRKEDALIYWSGDAVLNREIAKLQPAATLYPFGDGSAQSSAVSTQPVHNVAYIEHETMVVNAQDKLELPADRLSLKGKHNRYNSMAAAIAAQLLQIPNDVIRESLTQFAGVEHRLQYVSTVRGVRWINDSKATNVDSCFYALESMTTPVVLILGGKDKGNDYSQIDALVREKVHTLVFMGVNNEPLHRHFDNLGVAIIDTDNISDAVDKAYHAARTGDTVLLSPCCASFDLFSSYEDRGKQFKQQISNLL